MRTPFWGTLARTTFCAEPAGDSRTRSHFYAAVLAGRVPVIFDGGRYGQEDANVTTGWAWRADPPQPPEAWPLTSALAVRADAALHELVLDYTQFCIVVPYTQLISGEWLGRVLGTSAAELARLRAGLSRAAPALVYWLRRSSSCTAGDGAVDEVACAPDAFDRLQVSAHDYTNERARPCARTLTPI
jgi:hypothetical protein